MYNMCEELFLNISLCANTFFLQLIPESGLNSFWVSDRCPARGEFFCGLRFRIWWWRQRSRCQSAHGVEGVRNWYDSEGRGGWWSGETCDDGEDGEGRGYIGGGIGRKVKVKVKVRGGRRREESGYSYAFCLKERSARRREEMERGTKISPSLKVIWCVFRTEFLN
jgi:hypothetical protein